MNTSKSKVAEAVEFALDSDLSARWTDAIDATASAAVSESKVYYALVMDTHGVHGDDLPKAIELIGKFFDDRRGSKGDPEYAILNAYKGRSMNALRALAKGANPKAKYASTLGGLEKWYKDHRATKPKDANAALKRAIANAIAKHVETTGSTVATTCTLATGYVVEISIADAS
jgi:hypothetical protein